MYRRHLAFTVYYFCFKLYLSQTNTQYVVQGSTCSPQENSTRRTSQTISPSLAASPRSLHYLDLILLISPSSLFLITLSSTNHYHYVSLYLTNYKVHITQRLPPHLHCPSSSSYHPSKWGDWSPVSTTLIFIQSSLFFLPLFHLPALLPHLLSVPHLSLLPHLFFSGLHFNWKSGHGDTLLAKAPSTSRSACSSPINLSCKTHSADNTLPGLIFPAG